MNENSIQEKIRSKQTNFAPGDYLPTTVPFPGQSGWNVLSWVVGLLIGAFIGAGVAVVILGHAEQGSIGAFAGMAITYMILQDVSKGIIRSKGRHYYQQLMNVEPQNADACVQAGLWIHENVKTVADIEKGDSYYRKAIERYPGHRDATICLALSLSAQTLRAANYKGVIEILEPWLVNHEDFYAEVGIAESFKNLGEHKKAVAHFRRVLELYPGTPQKAEIEAYLRQHELDIPKYEMLKTAFLFPGQGAQFVGMGKDIAERFPAAKTIFDKANQILGFDIAKICFEGPAETLNTTTMSQPAIFTVSAAILEIFRTGEKTKNITADVTAGLSMGEYTALYAAGLISFEDGLKLVKKRGEAMQAAADKSKGGMVAIIGLDEEKTRALCAEAGQGELLEGVNFNCPGQIAISGAISACERAEKLAEKYGAMKAIRLEVAGAFHTAMMSSAADALSQALGQTNIKEPTQPKVIANITADYYTSANQIRQSLAKQLVQPIYWQKCVERLMADGVETFYEIGPGKVLTGLMKRIHRRANIINVSSAASINEL